VRLRSPSRQGVESGGRNRQLQTDPGKGVQTFRAGSCWIQPPKIKHTVRGYSDDCELLEIILPADFETVEL